MGDFPEAKTTFEKKILKRHKTENKVEAAEVGQLNQLNMADQDFDVEAFPEKENLSVEDLPKLKKARLQAMVDHASVRVSPSATKAGLVQAISRHLGVEERQSLPRVLLS